MTVFQSVYSHTQQFALRTIVKVHTHTHTHLTVYRAAP